MKGYEARVVPAEEAYIVNIKKGNMSLGGLFSHACSAIADFSSFGCGGACMGKPQPHQHWDIGAGPEDIGNYCWRRPGTSRWHLQRNTSTQRAGNPGCWITLMRIQEVRSKHCWTLASNDNDVSSVVYGCKILMLSHYLRFCLLSMHVTFDLYELQ